MRECNYCEGAGVIGDDDPLPINSKWLKDTMKVLEIFPESRDKVRIVVDIPKCSWETLSQYLDCEEVNERYKKAT